LKVTYTVVEINQTITFGALANQVLGTPPFAVSATASSGLPVSFASLTGTFCSVSGSTVTLLKAGTCTIQASQAGNATYNPATPVNQSFQITASPSVDVAVFGLPVSNTVSGVVYDAWALNINPTTSASNVVITVTVTAAAGVISGTPTGTVG